MRYYELLDELDSPEDRWFLRSLNVVDQDKISVWKFLSTTKIDMPFTEKLKISKRQEGKPLDFTFADFGVFIVNERVASFLNDDDCQLLPVEIDGTYSKHLYFVAILLNSIDCVDENRSTFEKWQINDPIRPDKAGMYKSIDELFIDNEKIPERRDVFRLGKYNIVTIISERLKKQFEKNAISGIRFKELL